MGKHRKHFRSGFTVRLRAKRRRGDCDEIYVCALKAKDNIRIKEGRE